MRKVLVSLLRRAALAKARRITRPLEDSAVAKAFATFLRKAERRTPITTAQALSARERGRR